MGKIKLIVVVIIVMLLSGQALAASFSKQITGLDFAEFEGRECVILRTAGGVTMPSAFKRDEIAAALVFELSQVGADGILVPKPNGGLIRTIDLPVDPQRGATLVVGLATPDLASQECFRFTQPSAHVLLLEIFPGPQDKEQSSRITDVEKLVPAKDQLFAPQHSSPAFNTDTSAVAADPLAGVPVVDLSTSDPSQVLGMLAGLGLLNAKGSAQITTEEWGELVVSPAGQSLVNWTDATPPGELLVSGTPAQIATLLAEASPAQVAAQLTLGQYWASSQPRVRARTQAGGAGADTRSRLRDDPYNGIYFTETMPGGGRLSDIRVTLNATGGLNLFDVLNYLSNISGISIVIDPYTFNEPTGQNRPPLPPDGSGSGDGGPGFRSASEFDPGLQRTGTVRGNFVNVPFDEVLSTILSTHNLEFIITNEGQPAGKRYGSRGDDAGSYEKPVILITSKERLEQELPGTNEIDLHQFHYADPDQITEILQQFGMLSPSGTGWYIYEGGGNGGGSGGGVGRGGNGNGRGGSTLANPAPPSVIAYQGATREPVLEQARSEVAEGRALARVILAPESDPRFLVTLLCR